jgi:cobalt-zinc-cadmium resistance protein CzcA
MPATNLVPIAGPFREMLGRQSAKVNQSDPQPGKPKTLGQPNLNIRVDRERAARYGLNSGDVNTVVQAALGGTVATTLLEADRQFNITVRVAPDYRADMDAVRFIKVGFSTASGANAYIPLSELAEISLDTGASYIYHERNERFIPIKFSVRGRDLGGTVAEAQARIGQNVQLPSGYRIAWAGEFESLQQAKQRLQIIVPISLALILVLLYGLFNSLRDSLMALAASRLRSVAVFWRCISAASISAFPLRLDLFPCSASP